MTPSGGAYISVSATQNILVKNKLSAKRTPRSLTSLNDGEVQALPRVLQNAAVSPERAAGASDSKRAVEVEVALIAPVNVAAPGDRFGVVRAAAAGAMSGAGVGATRRAAADAMPDALSTTMRALNTTSRATRYARSTL